MPKRHDTRFLDWDMTHLREDPLYDINFGGVGACGHGGATVQGGEGGGCLYPRPRT